MTDRQKDLLAALTMIQNHPAHSHHDIVTTAFCRPVMTEAELIEHIDANMAQIARMSDYGR